MLENDALLYKISIIRRCLQTIGQLTAGDPGVVTRDWEKCDLVVLQLQRGTQAAIDMANLVISKRGLRLPLRYRDSFSILAENKVISAELGEALGRMAGFRNIAVHDYQAINPAIVESILRAHLGELAQFCDEIHKIEGLA